MRKPQAVRADMAIRSAYRFALASLVTATSPLACADAPPVRYWVELNVWSCQAVTFEAPPYESSAFVRNDAHKTAVLNGTVVAAGIRPYDTSNLHLRQLAEQATSRLPQKGAQLQVATREWSAEFCKSVQGRVKRFHYNYSCDTFPHTGSCLTPLPLVDPVP